LIETERSSVCVCTTVGDRRTTQNQGAIVCAQRWYTWGVNGTTVATESTQFGERQSAAEQWFSATLSLHGIIITAIHFDGAAVAALASNLCCTEFAF
jgi:hypothetical protein